MPDTAPTAPIPADLPCIRCRYNLRGLLPTSNCAECGTPIWRTRHGSDPWGYRRFARIQFLYATLTILAFFTGIYLASLVHHTSNTGSPRAQWRNDLITRRDIASLILIVFGAAWSAASKFPRRSAFFWIMLAANIASLALFTPSLNGD